MAISAETKRKQVKYRAMPSERTQSLSLFWYRPATWPRGFLHCRLNSIFRLSNGLNSRYSSGLENVLRLRGRDQTGYLGRGESD